MRKRLRFALFGNEFQAKKSASIQKVLDTLNALDAEVSMESAFHDFLLQTGGIKAESSEAMSVFEGSDFSADFAISIGGDGTFLNTASAVGAKGIPIVGVNTGRLGFLADVRDEEIEQALQAICTGEYRIEEHSVIKMSGCDTAQIPIPFALNDIAVLKRDNASMITIHAYVDGDPLVTYQADGLIVSTPTGSTAYNLSNGGPIMLSQTDVLCLTPVASHSLTTRPIIVPDNCVIELDVESRTHNFLVAIDGRSATLDEGVRVTIGKADYKVRIVKRKSENFFSTLREKMMWGRDGRMN